MERKLTVNSIIKEGIGIGIKNMGPIIVNTILYVLTIWIPYLNIGTTIGMMVGIVAKASKGETISMTEIFDPKYRKYMGEFFLTSGLMSIGVSVGFLLFIVPGFIIAMAWSLSVLLAVDKEINPVEAISQSNKITYGYKGTIFGAQIILMILIIVASGIFSLIPYLGVLLSLAVSFIGTFINIGMQAYVYQTLSADIN